MSDQPTDLAYYRQLKSGLDTPAPSPPLQYGEGDGTSGGMDAWQQSVEARLEGLGAKIDRQLIWILGAFAAGFVILGGLIINRTDSLNEHLGSRIDAVSQRVSDLGERTAKVEARLPHAQLK